MFFSSEKIETKMYRVEAFIIPSNNINERLQSSNEIDDVKFANKLREESFKEMDDETELDENRITEILDELCTPKINSSARLEECFKGRFKFDEPVYQELTFLKNKLSPVKEESLYSKACFRINEPIYDEPYVSTMTNIKTKSMNGDSMPSRWSLPNLRQKYFGNAPKLPKRTSSLKVIEESAENFDATVEEVCYHGHKNGCTTVAKRPEDVSENVFKEHWLQRLESLRQSEAILKNKEVALQARERLLFKKEKELRILERLIKNKLKQTELYLSRYEKSKSAESVYRERSVASGSSGSLNEINREYGAKVSSKGSVASTLSNESDKYIRNPPNSTNSLHHLPAPANSRCSSNYQTESHTKSAYTFRSKQRPKISYEDMNSTLSADIGDSSYVKTSSKFNPETFKRPVAFRRTASERHLRPEFRGASKLISVPEQEIEDRQTEITEENVMKRVSNNILSAQDRSTKYQNYGLIDDQVPNKSKTLERDESVRHRKMSYLNLESAGRTSQARSVNTVNSRPVSWCEETDEWLQKKRQAYNMTIKKMQSEHFDEKENFNRFSKSNKSSVKNKKDAGKEKGKRFSIFR